MMETVRNAQTFYRDDCESVQQRTDGLSCVFARITSLNPLKVKDAKAQLTFEEFPAGMYDLMDYAYILIDTSARPFRCLRITVVPQELEPVAAYQFKISRERVR